MMYIYWFVWVVLKKVNVAKCCEILIHSLAGLCGKQVFDSMM